MDWAELLIDGALWNGLSEYRDIPAGVALAHVVAAAEGGPATELVPVPCRASSCGPDVDQPQRQSRSAVQAACRPGFRGGFENCRHGEP